MQAIAPQFFNPDNYNVAPDRIVTTALAQSPDELADMQAVADSMQGVSCEPFRLDTAGAVAKAITAYGDAVVGTMCSRRQTNGLEPTVAVDRGVISVAAARAIMNGRGGIVRLVFQGRLATDVANRFDDTLVSKRQARQGAAAQALLGINSHAV